MLDRKVRWCGVVAALGLLAAACGSGDAGPTTTEFIPPTSEVIFSLTTTTTTPPGPLDPVFIESLGVTVDFPRDWQFETEALRFGRASAAFRAENRSGGLIIAGDVADVLPAGAEPGGATPDDLAPVLATLLNVVDPLPDDAVQATAGPRDAEAQGVAYTITSYTVEESDGSGATMEIAVYADTSPVVFVAVLYQADFPSARVEQTQVFASLTVE